MSVNQFFEWKQNELSSYLLPPYQSINYFIYYCFNRFFAAYAISAIASFLFLFGAKLLNRKCGERFFEPEEPFWGALGVFLSGFPGFIFYALILSGAYLALHFYFWVRRRPDRIPLYYLWLPAALFAIIMNNFIIQNFALWQALKV
jgi:membrane associated rhomboid family serine protease